VRRGLAAAHRVKLRLAVFRLPARSVATTRIRWRAARNRPALIRTEKRVRVVRLIRLPSKKTSTLRSPDTRLVMLFRAAESRKVRFGKPTADCVFGVRTPIWPAEYTDPEAEAGFFEVYFAEFLGTNKRAFVVRGARPCDPTAIDWLR
jgi:hypothetical protein